MKYIKKYEYIRPTMYQGGKYYDYRYINNEKVVSENIWYFADILGNKIFEFFKELYPDYSHFFKLRRDRDESRLVLFISQDNFIVFMDDTYLSGKNKGLQLMILGPTKSVNDQYKLFPDLINIREYLFSVFDKYNKVKDPKDIISFCNFRKTKNIINVVNTISAEDYKLQKDVKSYNL